MLSEFDDDIYNDSVLSFMLGENVKGRFARVDKSLMTILSQHNYPEIVSMLIAEASLLAVMIGQAIKLRWKLSLQIRGSGPIKLIAVDYYRSKAEGSSSDIRAYAKFDYDKISTVTKSDIHLLGKGFFAILIDQGAGTEPYQGITPLTGNSLAECAEKYFEQSEQLPTAFKIIVGQNKISDNSKNGVSWIGGGMMLQQLPTENFLEKFRDYNFAKETVNIQIEKWCRVNILMNTVEELELVGPYITSSIVLNRLFHQESLVLFGSQKIKFGCLCSIDKVARTLSIYSSKDIMTMITENGNVTADCQFCGHHYVLDPNQLGFEAES